MDATTTLRPWYERHTAPPPPRVEEELLDIASLVAAMNDWTDPHEPLPDDAVLCPYTTADRVATGWLSRRHSASSYGHPVIVTHDGRALGPADVTEARPYLPERSDEVEGDADHAARIRAHPTVAAAIAVGFPIR